MTSSGETPLDTDALRRKLLGAGMLAPKAKLALQAYEPAYARRPKDRRWHYRLSTGDKVVCHLIVGLGLEDLHQRASQLFQACPQLTCRPLLFWEDDRGVGHLCIEHFHGESLEAKVKARTIDAATWIETARRAQAALASTVRASTSAAVEQEVRSLMEEVSTMPQLTDFDAVLLRELVEPAIRSAVRAGEVTMQWTNGDFIGSNLLLNEKGEIRLVDYEYAQLTHFPSGDWLRLETFSTPPPELDFDALSEIRQAHQPVIELQFWLRHLAHLKHVRVEGEVAKHLAGVVSELFRSWSKATQEKGSEVTPSYLLKTLSERQGQLDALAKQRTAWANSLEAEVSAARKAHDTSTATADERTAWALSLEAELTATRKLLEDQSAQLLERTAWAKTLEDQAETFEVQAKERAEWAKSLETELTKTREAFAHIEKEYAKRTDWARSLEAELEAARANFNQLTLAHQERTEWAISLQKDLASQVTRAADLAAANQAYVAELESVQLGKLKILRELQEAQHRTLATQKELVEKEGALREASAHNFAAQTHVESLEHKSQRFDQAVVQGQQHIDHLLLQIEAMSRATAEEREKVSAAIRDHEAFIATLSARSAALRAELDQYETSAICRWLKGSPKGPPQPPK